MNKSNQRSFPKSWFRNAICVLIVASSTTVLSAQTFHKVAQRDSIFAPTGDRYYGLGIPSINEVAVVDGRYNLAVDHTSSSGPYLGNGILSFSGCQKDCATGNASVYFDPQSPSYNLYLPSAQIASLEPAMLVGASIPGHEIRSGNTVIAGAPGIFFGRPSAEGGKVTYYQIDNQGKSLMSYDVPTGVPTQVVNGAGFTDIGMVSNSSSSDFGVSVSGQRLVFRGHNSNNASQNGIFSKVLSHNLDGTVTPGPQEVIARAGDSFGPGFSYPQAPALPAFESLPVAHVNGAAWSYSQTVPGKGENVYFGTASTGGPANISAIAKARTNPNDPYYGDVASGGFGPILFEVIPAAGGARRIGMNLHGKINLDYINTSMIPAGAGVIVDNLDMGSQAVMAEANPLTLSTGGAKLAFFADQNTAGGGATHQLDAVYVTEIAEFGIDFGGRFGADVVDPGRLPAEPQWFSTKGGGNSMQPPASDFVYMLGHDSLGQNHPLQQNYGTSLGVDSGSGEPTLLDASEAVTIQADYSLVLDTVTFTHLDVNEIVFIGVNDALQEYVYDGGGQGQYMDGIQGIELPLLVPAGSTLTIADGGVGDGFGLGSVILRRKVLGDYDWDGEMSVADIDVLVAEVASGSFDLYFDLNGDALVDFADVDEWLRLAGETNLPSGNAYLVADANLDGVVDGLDFIAWNENRFTALAAWSGGDFNADGNVDGSDFVEWNLNKFQAADGTTAAVPEPTSGLLMAALGLTGLLVTRRRAVR